MVKVVVFGGSGRTGRHVVAQALERGFTVKVIVRNPGKLRDIQDDRLEILQGDVLKPEDLQGQFTGFNVVISTFGLDTATFMPGTFYSQSVCNIMDAMRAEGISRLICLSSWFTRPSPEESFSMRWIYRPFVYGRVLNDMARMEEMLLTKGDDINYTVIRPPVLTEEELKRATVVCKEDVKLKDQSDHMPHANVARFLLDCINDVTTYRKMLAVAIVEHHSNNGKIDNNNT